MTCYVFPFPCAIGDVGARDWKGDHPMTWTLGGSWLVELEEAHVIGP